MFFFCVCVCVKRKRKNGGVNKNIGYEINQSTDRPLQAFEVANKKIAEINLNLQRQEA